MRRVGAHVSRACPAGAPLTGRQLRGAACKRYWVRLQTAPSKRGGLMNRLSCVSFRTRARMRGRRACDDGPSAPTPTPPPTTAPAPTPTPTPTFSVSGTISETAPTASRRVEDVQVSLSNGPSATTASDGTFTITGVATGTYTLDRGQGRLRHADHIGDRRHRQRLGRADQPAAAHRAWSPGAHGTNRPRAGRPVTARRGRATPSPSTRITTGAWKCSCFGRATAPSWISKSAAATR